MVFEADLAARGWLLDAPLRRRFARLDPATRNRWADWICAVTDELCLRITAPPGCVSQFIEANRLSTSEPLGTVPVTVTTEKRAAEFGWDLPADRVYTSHRREEHNIETKAWTDNAAEQSRYLHAWHQ